MMRTPLIVGNWKMHKTVNETVLYIRELCLLVKSVTDVEIVVAAPFTAVHAAAEGTRSTNVAVAAQDLYWETNGAFTGEVSASMIHEAGAEYAIVGHSERRTLFGETNETVNRKVLAALTANLVPIVCIGETLKQREQNQTMAVLDRQIRAGLLGIANEQMAGLVVAYEPVWAIGTGQTATAIQAQEVHLHIRQRLTEWFSSAVANECRVIYGGSVKPGNIAELVTQADVDGALVGSASLQVKNLAKIVTETVTVQSGL
jgi:triosephosphate isomerase